MCALYKKGFLDQVNDAERVTEAKIKFSRKSSNASICSFI